MSFTGKVAIVTGASSGIGAGIAVKLAEAGANVVLVGTNADKLKNVSDKCNSFGEKHHVVKGDVSIEADTKRLIDETIKKFGKIDVLVNNAGILRLSPVIGDEALAVYDEIMKTNLRAVINLTILASAHLIASRGNIVNISSLAGTKFLSGMSAYSVSKAALNHFSKGAALELAEHGVRVNVISPGPVLTDIIENAGIPENTFDLSGVGVPLSRVSSPEEIADLVLFLASDKAVGITGSNYFLDNGMLLK